jgi:4a-hydroxytetrahydrobiopterin dehydratase
MAESKRVYSESEVGERLKREAPKWAFKDGTIARTFRTQSWKGTLMVVNAIGHLAEAAWHHPDLSVSYDKVEVRLSDHDAKGISDKDFEMARKIDEFVGWRPGSQSALTGTPTDPGSAYIKYDA